MADSPFFTLHRDLPREGPGLPEDVHWALSHIDPPARVIDAACGPGADTETLAAALPEAQIHGVDKTAHFIADARQRCARFGPRVTFAQGDMGDLTGPADLIWCAGALYFLGVAEGLAQWRPALSDTGVIVFSHPVTEADDPPEVAQFWDGEPGVGPREMTEAAVASAGYKVLGYRRIVGAAWEAYYGPKAARIAKLRAEGPSDALAKVLDDTDREIALWSAMPERIAYGLWIVRPA